LTLQKEWKIKEKDQVLERVMRLTNGPKQAQSLIKKLHNQETPEDIEESMRKASENLEHTFYCVMGKNNGKIPERTEADE
jgi:hypothetical protein